MTRSTTLKTLSCAAAGAALLGAAAVAFASLIPGYPDDFRRAYDPREVALLPGYCKYTQLYRQHLPGGNDPAAIKRMYDVYGPGFHALHHYCWAIISTNRALYLARTKELRTFYLKEGIHDIDFVIENSPKDFVLLPELLNAKAKNLVRLGNGPQAVSELFRAIDLKPEYWPPYATLSDYYNESGEMAKAREVLERGLAIMPNTNALKRRLAELEQAIAKRGHSGTRANAR